MTQKKLNSNQTDPRNQVIANRIKQLREGAGYSSMESFAYDFGISRGSYWRAESGDTNITMKILYQIIDAHKLSLAEFFAPLDQK